MLELILHQGRWAIFRHGDSWCGACCYILRQRVIVFIEVINLLLNCYFSCHLFLYALIVIVLGWGWNLLCILKEGRRSWIGSRGKGDLIHLLSCTMILQCSHVCLDNITLNPFVGNILFWGGASVNVWSGKNASGNLTWVISRAWKH